jgi:hypothetical protein
VIDDGRGREGDQGENEIEKRVEVARGKVFINYFAV